MGILRFILALSVLIAHCSPILGIELIGARVAVQAFYIVSGFYMAFILSEKYVGANNSFRLFISNRFLRIYPIYWVVLCLTILYSIVVFIFTKGNNYGFLSPYFTQSNSLSIGSILLLLFSNVVIFFQDAILFLSHSFATGTTSFSSAPLSERQTLSMFFFIPQAWSVAIELCFYLVAPLLMKQRKTTILLILIVSLMVRYNLYYYQGLQYDPWTYRFFPTEIAFFILGIFSYSLYQKMKLLSINKNWLNAAFVILILCTFLYSKIDFSLKIYCYFALMVIAIPATFLLTKKSKIDRQIGELSYPIYLTHLFVLSSCNALKITNEENSGIIVLAFSLIISLLINLFISNKIERYRQRRIGQ